MQERKYDRLAEILDKLENIQTRFYMLEKRIQNIEDSCSNMDGHISFIEKIYEKMRAPLRWISGKFSSTSSLPEGRTRKVNLLRNRLTKRTQ